VPFLRDILPFLGDILLCVLVFKFILIAECHEADLRFDHNAK